MWLLFEGGNNSGGTFNRVNTVTSTLKLIIAMCKVEMYSGCEAQQESVYNQFVIKNQYSFSWARRSYFFQQFEAQNVLILFVTAKY